MLGAEVSGTTDGPALLTRLCGYLRHGGLTAFGLRLRPAVGVTDDTHYLKEHDTNYATKYITNIGGSHGSGCGMTILFTVPGLFGDVPRWLGGDPGLALKFLGGQFTPGGTLPKCLGGKYAPVTEHRPVSYSSWLPFRPGGWWGAAAALDKALLEAPKNRQLIVTSHSQGAGGVGQWLQDKSAACPIEPDRLLLVTLGVAAPLKLPWFTKRKYPIIDVTVQWDMWADQPDRSGPALDLAKRNASAGDSKPNPNLHVNGYQSISLDGPHRERKIDTATFMLFDTARVPLAGVSREQIESAYSRPYLT